MLLQKQLLQFVDSDVCGPVSQGSPINKLRVILVRTGNANFYAQIRTPITYRAPPNMANTHIGHFPADGGKIEQINCKVKGN